MTQGTSRRELLASGAIAAFTIVPRYVLGGQRFTPPSEDVNLALIGAGGRGTHDALLADRWGVDREARDLDIPEHEVLSGRWDSQRGYENRSKEKMVNFVALCDVDTDRPSKLCERFPEARFYKDYRQMLDQTKDDVDAVIVATPDHSHFHATLSAMQLGLHAYTEKPLTRTVSHARRLTEAAGDNYLSVFSPLTQAVNVRFAPITSGALVWAWNSMELIGQVPEDAEPELAIGVESESTAVLGTFQPGEEPQLVAVSGASLARSNCNPAARTFSVALYRTVPGLQVQVAIHPGDLEVEEAMVRGGGLDHTDHEETGQVYVVRLTPTNERVTVGVKVKPSG